MSAPVKSDPVHPWVKGFIPPAGQCPRCPSKVITFTGERIDSMLHVYHCYPCGADFAVPTFYAICDYDNSTLEKDIFYTPCIHGKCGHFKGLPHNPTRCMHFRPAQAGDFDAKVEQALEASVIKFHEPEKQPYAEPTGGGVNSDMLEKMRRDRLKRLEEET